MRGVMAGTLTRVPTMVPNIHRNVDGEVAYAASAIYRLANDYTLKPSLNASTHIW